MSEKMWHRVVSRCVAGALSIVMIAACGQPAGNTAEPGPPAVTVLTHEGWWMPADLQDAFRRQTGIELSVKQVAANAAALTEQLTASAGRPEGDVAVGLPGRHAKRALAADVFTPYTSPEANQGQNRFTIDDQQRVSAVDLADVCVNVDKGWFAKRSKTRPDGMTDLARPGYADLIALPDPRRTEIGFAFLLATIARYGENGWQDYWSRLRDNGAGLLPSFQTAYRKRFSGASKSGSLPLVVARASSPATELDDGTSPVAVLPGTCFRTVRYAGVLEGAAHASRAQRVIDFLLSQQFQAGIAPTYGTYPTREGVELPDGWRSVAPLRTEPLTLSAADVNTNERRWLRQWQALWR